MMAKKKKIISSEYRRNADAQIKMFRNKLITIQKTLL